jgi:hypothetical protein
MFPSIRARWDAHRLSRKLRNSLATPSDNWKVETDDDDGPALAHGDFRIVLVPRGARLFDAIHVYSAGAEIWMPLMARLRLRAAARSRLLHAANAQWSKPARKGARARRRRAKPAV